VKLAERGMNDMPELREELINFSDALSLLN
jgi:hypothetical protein